MFLIKKIWGDKVVLTFEIWATIFGLLQGILVLLNNKYNWLFYIAQIGCLIVFSYFNKLYADTLCNIIYLMFGIRGWILWNKNNAVKISNCSLKEKIMYSSIICIGAFLINMALKITPDPLPLIDAVTTSSSLVATYYMVKKKLDTWIIWFINDICYIIEYSILQEPAYYLISLNTIWSIMSIISYFNWRRIMKGEKYEKNIFCRKIQ